MIQSHAFKSIGFFLFTLCSGMIAHSQTTPTDSLVIQKKKCPSEGYWGGLSASIVSMALIQGDLEDAQGMWGSPQGLGLVTNEVSQSWRIGLNPFEHRQRLLGEFVALTTGIGFDWWHVSVDKDHTLVFDSDADLVVPQVGSSPPLDLTKNQMDAVYIRVPILASLRTSRFGDSGLHIEAGFVGAYRIFNQYSYSYTENEQTTKVTSKDIPINPLQLHARLGVGFGNVSLLTEMSLMPFFDETRSPAAHSISVGIHFAFNKESYRRSRTRS